MQAIAHYTELRPYGSGGLATSYLATEPLGETGERRGKTGGERATMQRRETR